MASQQPAPKHKLVAFFDKTSVKVTYSVLAFTLAVVMFFIAVDTGSLLDYAIVVLLLYMGTLDTITVVRRMRAKRKHGA